MTLNSDDSSPLISVLIVEDTQSLLKLYSHILEQAGYRVTRADNGSRALECIAAETPDIVLLDRVLPDMDGSQICSYIKTSDNLNSIYVIMLSALRITEDDRVSGLEAGADDYIIKPIGRRELLARVNVATRLRRTQKALQESEAMFRTLAENSPDIIERISRDHKLSYVNNTIERFTGRPASEFLDTRLEDIESGNPSISRWASAVRDVFETGHAQSIEYHLSSICGERVMDARLVPEADQNGVINSILSVARDFTEHAQAEQQVARLATVVEQAIESVVITDREGDIVFANAALEEMIGIASDEIVGKSLQEMTAIFSGDYCHKIQQAIKGEVPWSGSGYCTRNDGQKCEIEGSVSPIYNRSGQIIDFAVIQRDVTERKRTERQREALLRIATALRSANQRSEMLPIVLEQLMSVLSISSALIVAPNYENGMSVVEDARGVAEDVVGQHFPSHEVYVPERSPSDSVYISNHINGSSNHPIISAMGNPLAAAAVPLMAEPLQVGTMWVGSDVPIDAETISFLLAVADMAATAMHSADLYEEIQRYAVGLEQMVAERTQELASANKQLLELDRLKSKFVSNVSHELRTPISNLKLYVALLQRGKPERRAQYETMLRVSVERLGQLVEDILNLSRIEIAHQKKHVLEPTDLNGVASQVVSLHQPQAEAAGIRLVYEPDPTLPLMAGDFNQLSQLVTNLVANALNYTRDGQILVSTSYVQDDNTIRLVIEDTGIGIMAEDLPHLFDRFYRGNHRQKNDIPGTGLGLAIVREIVDIHEGSITVSSEIDKGTKIDVRFHVEEMKDELTISWLR